MLWNNFYIIVICVNKSVQMQRRILYDHISDRHSRMPHPQRIQMLSISIIPNSNWKYCICMFCAMDNANARIRTPHCAANVTHLLSCECSANLWIIFCTNRGKINVSILYTRICDWIQRDRNVFNWSAYNDAGNSECAIFYSYFSTKFSSHAS